MSEENNTNYLQIQSEQYKKWNLSWWKKFRNVFPELDKPRKLKHIWEALTTNHGNEPTSAEEADMMLPIQQPDFSVVKDGMKAIWLGHSTVLIQDGYTNILTDPVFSERASPISFMGPKRFRRPACLITQLPRIDAVFISHDHHDHFDKAAIEWLARNHRPKFFIGRESQDLFPKSAEVVQLDWNQPAISTIAGKPYRIHFFPVCHWSMRAVFDTDQRLWGGFIIQNPDGMRIFYSGDTGFCKVFEQIGKMYSDGFDLSLIPIGAYLPRPLLSPQHVDPHEATIIHQQIKSRKSIGVHWGTFPLGRQHYLAPRKDLQQAKSQLGVPEDDFVCLKHGESLLIPRRQRQMITRTPLQ